ncbi:hypothetical protein [Archangium sp.]|uniref:hypothetical protein n=1 Tax=Archangium sp. TaxID=1872627 RepID=UPI002D63449F|nr:hypothetical protein [Archangium sp.]HYO53522.1 hypothetical protein [Archangium sp.]
MLAEILPHRWVAPLLGVVLLTTGCATLAPQSGGSGSQGSRAMSVLRETTAGTPPLQRPSSLGSTEPGEQERLHRRRSARGLGVEVAMASGETPSQGSPTCGGQAVPPGWPDFSSGGGEALLAPFLTCTSPAEFVALQDRVDMPRLVEALDDWSAVRLGALGPVRDDAAEALNRKRASFLVQVTQERGPAEGEVFALFLIQSAFGDELEEVLRLLAGDKRLGETLGRMGFAREVLEQRGLNLSNHEDRPERLLEDMARGAGSALGEAFTTPTARNARVARFSVRRGHLPPPFQQLLDDVEKEERLRSFAPGNVARGVFDELTFGIPLGLYGAVTGLGHGARSLSRGQYERAARELTPAAMMVALYAGGKGLRSLSEARGGPRLQLPELRVKLAQVVTQLEARLGADALGELARYIQARREAGRLVAVGGPEAAIALHEARGDVARAQVWLSQAKPQRAGEMASVADDTVRPTPKRAHAAERPGGMASLVDEQAGLTREVLEARLALVERESTGPRLPRDVAVLEKQRPSLDAPPPGAEGNPRWSEYVAYREKRLGEIKQDLAVEGPLRWEPYEMMRGWFARGLAFERVMVELLRADAALPRALRRFLGDFDRPRVERYVGVWKPKSGLRFADVLIIEEGQFTGRFPRVETLSFKSRNFSGLKYEALEAQMISDAREALGYYGETLDIRRPSLQHLLREGSEVPVRRVRLIYEGGALKPKGPKVQDAAVDAAKAAVPGVEVLFQ